MALQPNRRYIGVPIGTLFLQAGEEWTTNQWGLDTGSKSWETHASTPEELWPKWGDVSARYRKMFICDLRPTELDCGMIRLDASYKGSKTDRTGIFKERILPSCDLAMFSIPSLGAEDAKVRLTAPVPKPRLTREYLTTTRPTLNGVAQPYAASFLDAIALPTFSISFVPDPDEAQTLNYRTGWILENRQWEDVAGQVWAVRESFSYYWNIAV